MNFVDKVVGVHARLEEAGFAHAFGGALALAYHARPRGTVDIDLDVFVPPARAPEVFEVLGAIGVAAPADATSPPVAGQRGTWGDTPVALFFAYDEEFFRTVASRVEHHLFIDSAGAEHVLPFLSAEDLVAFKITFDRPRDWLDIEEMFQHRSLEVSYVEHWLVHLRESPIWPRLRRFAALAGRTVPVPPASDEPASD